MNLIEKNEQNTLRTLAEEGLISNNIDPTHFVTYVGDFYDTVQKATVAMGGYAIPSKTLDYTKLMDLIKEESILEVCSQSQYEPNKEYLVTTESAKYDFATELDKAGLKDSPTMGILKAVEARINTCVNISEDAKASMIFSPKTWCVDNVIRVFADAVSEGIIHNSDWGFAHLTPVEYNAEGSEAIDKLRYVKTGVADAMSNTPFVQLSKMVDCVHGAMLFNCKFFMNHRIFNKLLAAEDAGKFIVYDKGYKLFGFPVILFSHVDDEDENKFVAYFGNFKCVNYAVQKDGVYAVEDVASNFPNSLLYMSMIFSVAIDGRKIVALKCAE